MINSPGYSNLKSADGMTLNVGQPGRSGSEMQSGATVPEASEDLQTIKDKIEWTVVFLVEFGKRHGLTLKQSFNYLLRYKGIQFVERHYDYLHTQSFTSVVDDLTEYCHKMGGGIE